MELFRVSSKIQRFAIIQGGVVRAYLGHSIVVGFAELHVFKNTQGKSTSVIDCTCCINTATDTHDTIMSTVPVKKLLKVLMDK
jgi:hypothetical protein